MKTMTLTEAKEQLGALCEAALKGQPAVISRDGRLFILQAYTSPDPLEPAALGYFADCYTDPEEIQRENRCAQACD
jgi:hypothetical protein